MNKRKEMLIHDFPENEIIGECDICGSMNKINHNTKIPHNYQDGECQEHGCDEYWIHDTGDEMENCECYYDEQSGSVCNCGAREIIDMQTGSSTFLNGEGAVAPTWDLACNCVFDQQLVIFKDPKPKMPEFCKLCNKELVDELSRERGIGKTCYKKFSQKIIALKSESIELKDLAILLEDNKCDIVYHDKGSFEDDERIGETNGIYYLIDEPPFIEKLSYKSKTLEDFALRFGLRETDNHRWADLDDLCQLHDLVDEPEWMIMFRGSYIAKTIIPGEGLVNIQSEWEDTQYFLEAGCPFHDLSIQIREILGWEYVRLMTNILNHNSSRYFSISNLYMTMREKHYDDIRDGIPLVQGEINPYWIENLIKDGIKSNPLNPFEGAKSDVADSLASYNLEHILHSAIHSLENCDFINGFWNRNSAKMGVRDEILKALNEKNSLEKE